MLHNILKLHVSCMHHVQRVVIYICILKNQDTILIRVQTRGLLIWEIYYIYSRSTSTISKVLGNQYSNLKHSCSDISHLWRGMVLLKEFESLCPKDEFSSSLVHDSKKSGSRPTLLTELVRHPYGCHWKQNCPYFQFNFHICGFFRGVLIRWRLNSILMESQILFSEKKIDDL